MSAHTPGPWSCEMGYGNHGLRIDGPNGEHLGHVRAFIPSVEVRHGAAVLIPWGEGQANARLVKAAPDLLLALEMLLDWHLSTVDDDGDYSAVRDAVAAIAAAKGETA